MSMLTTVLVIPFIQVGGLETLSMSDCTAVGNIQKCFSLLKLNHQGRDEVVGFMLKSTVSFARISQEWGGRGLGLAAEFHYCIKKAQKNS